MKSAMLNKKAFLRSFMNPALKIWAKKYHYFYFLITMMAIRHIHFFNEYTAPNADERHMKGTPAAWAPPVTKDGDSPAAAAH